MIRRGEVWIAPESFVPPGRMIEPDAADFWVSWQDDEALQDDVVHGASAAIEWGRERAEFVMIRLGHSAGTYFSAGDRPPADEDGIPRWPPAGPPPEGWWYPPPLPTLADVSEIRERVARGELETAAARAWAEERVAVFQHELVEKDLATLKALVDLQDDHSPPRRAPVTPAGADLPSAARKRPGWKELRDHWAEDAGARVAVYVPGTTTDDWQRAIDYLVPPWSATYSEDGEEADKPASVAEIFGHRATRSCELQIALTPLIGVSARFFTPDEIEFDFDPEELLNDADLNELFRFVRVLGRGLGRTVYVGISAQGPRRPESLRYEPAPDRFVSGL